MVGIKLNKMKANEDVSHMGILTGGIHISDDKARAAKRRRGLNAAE